MAMSMEGYPDISLPRNVKHLLHVKSDPSTGTLVGMPPSWISRLNSENSLSNNTELDIYKRSYEEMTMLTTGDPDISSPRNLLHNLHVTYDSHAEKVIGLPSSWIGRLNSNNSLSIRNDMDMYKSSGIKNWKCAELEMYPPLNVRDVAHLTLDSAPREITGTYTAGNNHFNSSTISMTHIDKTAEDLLSVLHYHDAGMEGEVYGHLPTRTGFQIPVERASRKHMNSRSAAGHMRADVDQTDAVYIHKQLAMLSGSVGIIISPTVCATGFRVGANYVMTAKHVVDQIIKETPTGLTTTTQPSNKRPLQNADVYIDFDHERNGQPRDGMNQFYFEPDILYANDNLDTVILKLKPNEKMYPPPLIQFSSFSEQTSHGYFVGHPSADIKKSDKYKLVTLTPYDITAAKRWSLSQAGVDGFVGIDDLHRVLLHCSFGKGASGSPGFWICPNNGQAYVVLMLVRGYPDWYYDDKHPAATKAGFPLNHLVEQGVCMESIFNHMKNNAPGLWEDIFCCV